VLGKVKNPRDPVGFHRASFIKIRPDSCPTDDFFISLVYKTMRLLFALQVDRIATALSLPVANADVILVSVRKRQRALEERREDLNSQLDSLARQGAEIGRHK
jgi:hypothetical protein